MEAALSLPELVMTQDGSYTLFSREFGVTYHSKYGAIQESNHVFIASGLLPTFKITERIKVLEVGFGTGLNALLTWKNIQDTFGIHVDYHTFDIFPLPENMLKECAYRELLQIPVEVADKILKSSWNETIEVDQFFKMKKYFKNILSEPLPRHFFNLVYFDAFSPESQPELWSPFIFEKIFSAMEPGGHLVTYCAKGEVKRTLKKIGFAIESLPGPPGKREMTRATKTS